MARRKLSTRGRVVAAGICVGVTGLLAGLMAATDDTGTATAGTSGQGSNSATVPGGARSGSGYDGSSNNGGNGRAGDPGSFQGDGNSSFGGQSGTSAQPTFPQPNTRSGGS
jgi:hypothetical protein